MIKITHFEPFYTKIQSNNKLILTFASGSIVATIHDQDFKFIPMEAHSIHININKSQLMNTEDIFLFKNASGYKRITLEQLLLTSNISKYLRKYFNDVQELTKNSNDADTIDANVQEEANALVISAEDINLKHLIDAALDAGDKERFYKLTALAKNEQ